MKLFAYALLGVLCLGCASKPGLVVDFKVSPIKPKGDVTISKAFADKPVMVYVWATWCGPCKEFAPTLNRIAKDYGNSVEFMAIAQDEKEKVVAAENRDPHELEVYLDTYGSLSNYIETPSLPTLVVLNKKHEIIWQQQGVGLTTERELRNILDYVKG
jgi:thiol-disulfide isomerase/thioredoxin